MVGGGMGAPCWHTSSIPVNPDSAFFLEMLRGMSMGLKGLLFLTTESEHDTRWKK